MIACFGNRLSVQRFLSKIISDRLILTPFCRSSFYIHAPGNAVHTVEPWPKGRSVRLLGGGQRYRTLPEGALFEGFTLCLQKALTKKGAPRPLLVHRDPKTSRACGPPSSPPSLSPSPLHGASFDEMLVFPT